MTKFERKYGRYAIQNLTLMLIMCYGVGYIISFISPEFLHLLTLNPYAIIHGEIWRLLTWVVIPPEGISIFTLITLFFYYWVGVSLERTWGDYKYNVYIFSGLILTIIGSFVTFLLLYFFYPQAYSSPDYLENIYFVGSSVFGTYYVNMSILLAFATTFPNEIVLLMFVIPVKIKWLGLIEGGLLLMQFVLNWGSPLSNIFNKTAIVSSLLNFIVFFIITKKPRRRRNLDYFKRNY